MLDRSIRLPPACPGGPSGGGRLPWTSSGTSCAQNDPGPLPALSPGKRPPSVTRTRRAFPYYHRSRGKKGTTSRLTRRRRRRSCWTGFVRRFGRATTALERNKPTCIGSGATSSSTRSGTLPTWGNDPAWCRVHTPLPAPRRPQALRAGAPLRPPRQRRGGPPTPPCAQPARHPAPPEPFKAKPESCQDAYRRLVGKDPLLCPTCRVGRLVVVADIPAHRFRRTTRLHPGRREPSRSSLAPEARCRSTLNVSPSSPRHVCALPARCPRDQDPAVQPDAAILRVASPGTITVSGANRLAYNPHTARIRGLVQPGRSRSRPTSLASSTTSRSRLREQPCTFGGQV
jgi:hypothetical protein